MWPPRSRRAYDCRFVVTGFNREEAEEFPDNGAKYVEAVNRGFEFSTRNGVRIMSFTQDRIQPILPVHRA